MLDTNICVYAIGRKRLGVLERFERESGLLCISTITLGELRYGVAKSARQLENSSILSLFLNEPDVLPFDHNSAGHFGQIRAHLEREGTPCGPYDMLIAAHARSEGLTVVTNNRREFDRMPGVHVENWV
jgi:tRNA(fMet)-specific endonuclease VapC